MLAKIIERAAALKAAARRRDGAEAAKRGKGQRRSRSGEKDRRAERHKPEEAGCGNRDS